ncbi:hypothetical protein C8Q74DRAFT_1248266 [Fomes fomentarius]|nr:hypothetical protein C8Q74DRAFT_1248266 [Fomes fomentarius]
MTGEQVSSVSQLEVLRPQQVVRNTSPSILQVPISLVELHWIMNRHHVSPDRLRTISSTIPKVVTT